MPKYALRPDLSVIVNTKYRDESTVLSTTLSIGTFGGIGQAAKIAPDDESRSLMIKISPLAHSCTLPFHIEFVHSAALYPFADVAGGTL